MRLEDLKEGDIFMYQNQEWELKEKTTPAYVVQKVNSDEKMPMYETVEIEKKEKNK
jgi:hypothetical protein